jgi:hypothetical protein
MPPFKAPRKETKIMLHAIEYENHAMPQDADGFAIPAADLLADFLIEHGDDPNEGPPESWPWWTDLGQFELGRAFFPQEVFDDLPDEDDDDNPF